MADQDFQINIKTLADLTGIKLTQAQLDALQKAAAEGNQKAIGALKQLSDAQKKAQSDLTVGFAGSAIGVGTIISLVTGAINKWKAFNEEQDRMVEGMIRAQEKVRALGETIIDMQDAAISVRRVGTEPLEQSYIRLQQEIIRLKTEQSLLNLPEQGEEWKKLNSEIRQNEVLLDRVTSALERQKDEAERAAKEQEKAAEKKLRSEESFYESAVKTASLQVQRTLQQEEAARRTGDEAYQRSAEAFKRGFTPAQREEYEALTRGANQQGVIDAIQQLRQDLIGIWR